MRGRRTTLAVTLAAVAVIGLAAQDPRPSGNIPERAARLDVVVVDHMGHAVVGLETPDFEVFEAGVPSPVRSVEYHRRGRVVPPLGETDEDAARAAREPGTRVYAFFLDELHVSASNADLVRRTMAAFIDEKLEPRDLVAVMTPFDAARSLRFTRDRAFAHGVIASFEGRKGDDRPRTAHEARVFQAAAGKDAGGTPQIVKNGLRDLALRLGELQAQRPVLVVFSEGFPADTDAASSRLQDLGGLLRAASRFHITTFAFNPAPVAPDFGVSPQQTANRETLQWLAAETGGRAVDADQFIHGVAGLFHDTEGYYAVTYRTAEPDGRYRPLRVRVKRRGASVLTQRGHWAMRDGDWAEVIALPSAPVPATQRALRRSSFVDAWVGIRREPSSSARIVITWEPRRGVSGLPSVVAVKARSPGGTLLFEGQVADLVTFPAPPGRIELDLTILDAKGTILDTDARHVDVPEFRSSRSAGPLLLPAWIVRTATPRALQLASDDVLPPAASRTFHRSQRLLVRVPVFDPGGGGARVTATLLNQRGQPMRGLDALGPPRDDVTEFGLPLAALASGEYQLELRAVNGRGAATGRVTFRVVG
jgi:VWFA-related protein